MWLLLAFIAVPMIEIALFIQVGGFIGLWWTLLIVLATAVAGSYMVRAQGMREIANLQRSFSDMRDPTEPLANGAMILFAGALLLTPGFFTDIVGLSLLLPPVRAAAFSWIRSRVKVQSFNTGDAPRQNPRTPQDRVIDGDYEDVTRDPTEKTASKQDGTRPQRPSGWTQD